MTTLLFSLGITGAVTKVVLGDNMQFLKDMWTVFINLIHEIVLEDYA